MTENPNLSDLSSITLEQFTFSLLNRIFWTKRGSRPASLEIAGVTVTKSLQRYSSNTGKSCDWKVTFSFIDAKGERHYLEKESHYSSNRRNDPGRDWGLP